MTDVLHLLQAPAPWDSHGATTGLPGAMRALLSRWPGRPADFFRLSGGADAALAAAGVKAPGLRPGDAVPAETIAPATLTALQAAVAEAGAAGRRHLAVTGPVAWTGTLAIAGATGLRLDLSGAEIVVKAAAGPLIRVTDSRKVTLAGLRVARAGEAAVAVEASEDIALTGLALGGAGGAALHIGPGSRRVLIDASALAVNTGPGVAIAGDATQVIVARTVFDRAGAAPFIAVTGGEAAEVPAHPMDIRILDCRFERNDGPAIRAQGVCGLWVEGCDFAQGSGSAVESAAGSVGVLLADNRFRAAPGARAPQVALADTGLIGVFRNLFDPAPGQEALDLAGRFGGVLIAANSLVVGQRSQPAAEDAAIRLRPDRDAFLATTLMVNTIRGPFGSGLAIEGALPRLFLFDNHVFGTRDWSLDCRVKQPFVTSLNNWSPVASRNVKQSDTASLAARAIRTYGWRGLIDRLAGRTR